MSNSKTVPLTVGSGIMGAHQYTVEELASMLRNVAHDIECGNVQINSIHMNGPEEGVPVFHFMVGVHRHATFSDADGLPVVVMNIPEGSPNNE